MQSEPEPLALLTFDENSFRIDAKAFNSVLAKVGNRPFVIMSISGKKRTGKSYILSHFIRYFESKKRNPDCSNSDWYNESSSPAFIWRSGRGRVTEGINLWSEPYFVKTTQGEELAVLLMDTQGLFDEQTTARQNSIIASLSALFASVMIVNTMRLIDESILEHFNTTSGYAHLTSVYPNENSQQSLVQAYTDASTIKDSTPSIDNCFPGLSNAGKSKCVFLIRDFDVPEYKHGLHDGCNKSSDINNNNSNANNYYRDTFILEGRPNCPEENKLMRESILNNFDTVSTYCLPDPGKPFRRQKVNSQLEKPDKDFQEEVIAFIEWMVDEVNLVKKTVLGQPTTGIQFQNYVDNWATLFSKAGGTFPDVPTLADNAITTQYSIIFNFALFTYKHNMDRCIRTKCGAVSPQELEKIHTKWFNFSKSLFTTSQKKRCAEYEKKFLGSLEEALTISFDCIQNYNITYRDATSKIGQKVLRYEALQEMQVQMKNERIKCKEDVRQVTDENENLRDRLKKERIRYSELLRTYKQENEQLHDRLEYLLKDKIRQDETNRHYSNLIRNLQRYTERSRSHHDTTIRVYKETNEKLLHQIKDTKLEKRKLLQMCQQAQRTDSVEVDAKTEHEEIIQKCADTILLLRKENEALRDKIQEVSV